MDVNIFAVDPHSDALEEICSLYEDAKHLSEVQTKSDPTTQPHLSLWAGIHIYLDIISKLNKVLDEADPDVKSKIMPRITTMIGGIWCKIGTIYMDLEEPAVEKQFRNCLDYLEIDSLHPERIITLITALNSLGLIYSQHDHLKQSKEYLEKAKQRFDDFTKNSSIVPVHVNSLFCATPISDTIHEEAKKALEEVHTLTLYYLAQVYGKLDDHLQSAVFYHYTLKRQLVSKIFDPIDWALNAATLSQYFTEKNRFPEARHHLSAASSVLDRYEEDINHIEGIEEEELNAKKETLNHRRADVSRCWCKYGILLLIFSRERLMMKAEEDDGTEVEEDEQDIPTPKSDLWFTSLDLSRYESQVTDQFALMFEDARQVFLNSQEWINKAKEYYTLEDHASDYAELVRDHSELYKSLIFFEGNDARQCCMHKRRIDLMEAVLTELNPQYYTNICRQLYYDAGEAYSEILDVKLENLKCSSQRPTPHMLKKINTLAEDSIKSFNKFLDTMRVASTNEMPVKISEELVRPALLAHFHIGRLCHKIIVTDKQLQIENTQRSLDAYKYLVDYCDGNEDAAKQMSLELSVVKEMIQLLPLKIAKLLRDTPN